MERKTTSAKNTALEWTFRNLLPGVVLTRGIQTALHGDPTASKRAGEEGLQLDQTSCGPRRTREARKPHERSGFVRVHPPAPPCDRAAPPPERSEESCRRCLQNFVLRPYGLVLLRPWRDPKTSTAQCTLRSSSMKNRPLGSKMFCDGVAIRH